MAIRPVVDPDPLGIIADTEGIQMPLSDWKGIAGLGLTYEQVVRLYGNPPKAAQRLFRVAAKSPPVEKSARHRPTAKVARRSLTRT
jgi:hypothetical protein